MMNLDMFEWLYLLYNRMVLKVYAVRSVITKVLNNIDTSILTIGGYTHTHTHAPAHILYIMSTICIGPQALTEITLHGQRV